MIQQRSLVYQCSVILLIILMTKLVHQFKTFHMNHERLCNCFLISIFACVIAFSFLFLLHSPFILPRADIVRMCYCCV